MKYTITACYIFTLLGLNHAEANSWSYKEKIDTFNDSLHCVMESPSFPINTFDYDEKKGDFGEINISARFYMMAGFAFQYNYEAHEILRDGNLEIQISDATGAFKKVNSLTNKDAKELIISTLNKDKQVNLKMRHRGKAVTNTEISNDGYRVTLEKFKKCLADKRFEPIKTWGYNDHEDYAYK